MQHDIIDNRSVKLVEMIQQILPGCESAKFAVGYFIAAGQRAVAPALEPNSIRDMRLLIANVSNRATIEQIAEGYRRLEDVARRIEAQTHPSRTHIRTMWDEAARDVSRTLGS